MNNITGLLSQAILKQMRDRRQNKDWGITNLNIEQQRSGSNDKQGARGVDEVRRLLGREI